MSYCLHILPTEKDGKTNGGDCWLKVAMELETYRKNKKRQRQTMEGRLPNS
jgi:hypothetical protein